MAAFKLNQRGIELVDKFLSDFESGNVSIEVGANYSDGRIMYFRLSNPDLLVCCFVDSFESIAGDVINQIITSKRDYLERSESGLYSAKGGIVFKRSFVESVQ